MLPFTDLSDDPGQDYFSDGITRDIITELSRFSELFVIASNSSFRYKDKTPNIGQVGRELGALKAVHLDPNLPVAHSNLRHVLPWKRRHEASIAEFEKAVALNPNDVDWRFSVAWTYAGQPKRAIEVAETYMRLDPFHPPLASGFLGFAHYMLKQYAQALLLLRESVSRALKLRPAMPGSPPPTPR